MVKVGRKSRLPASLQQELVRLFVAGVSARTAAELVGVNRNTAILYFHKLRELIAEKLTQDAPFLDGEIEFFPVAIIWFILYKRYKYFSSFG